MAVVELTDKKRIRALLADDPMITLEALDENILGVEGLVSIFATDDEPRPVNMMVVRWGQKNLGLGSLGLLRAGRLTGLEDVVAALPADRGHYDVLLPFWASPAITSTFKAEVLGAEATYVVERDRLRASPVARQCVRLDDPEIIRPMFPKLAHDTPAHVLSLKNELVAVAAVTHLQEDVARVFVYTIASARQHGFGRGVLTALTEELLALRIVPTIEIDLGDENAVRMVENAGYHQRAAHLKVRITGKRDEPVPLEPSLVQLGARRS